MPYRRVRALSGTSTKCEIDLITFLQTIDGVEPHDNDPFAEIFGRKTGHLAPEDWSFLSHWEELVSTEEQVIMLYKNQLWTITAEQREKSGR